MAKKPMIVHVNNIELYYEKSGSGRALILVHGNGETHEIFTQAVESLSRQFTVYAIDLRGHGHSSSITEYHYRDMATDLYEFIKALNIEQPIFYGFSDGGIIGLLLASKHPTLLSKLIVSGSNINPRGVKTRWSWLFRWLYLIGRDGKIRMMLKEPNITLSDLHHISTPTLVLAGEKDIIKRSHTLLIANNIANSTLKILKGETHGSYVINSDKLAPIITEFSGTKLNSPYLHPQLPPPPHHTLPTLHQNNCRSHHRPRNFSSASFEKISFFSIFTPYNM